MAANVINSTTLGPRVAVKLEPDVCVIKYPRAYNIEWNKVVTYYSD